MSLANIKTIILVMFENRSFDHMLGHLSYEGINPEAEGLTKPLNREEYQNSFEGDVFTPFPIAGDTQMDLDIPHEYNFVATQLSKSNVNGKFSMDGFVEAYAKANNVIPSKEAEPMGFFSSKQVPITSFLAQKYSACDNWFCPLPTSTQPNRTMAFCGQSAIFKTGLQFMPITGNIFEWMENNEVSWRVYHDGLSIFALYPGLWSKVLGPKFRDYENLFHDLQQGTDVPQVIVVEPSYLEAPHIGPDHPNDNHAPLAIGWGEDFLRRTYQAATVNPGLWQNTLMVVYYDEHGGFYDHVQPPVFNNKINANPPPPNSFVSLGPRVPAVLVSPWVEPGKITKHLFDHTSVLQLLAEKFTPGTPYSASVAARGAQGINSLSAALTDTKFSDPPLPPPSEPIFVKSALGDKIATQPDSDIGRAFEKSARDMMATEPVKVAAKYPELFQWKDSVDKSR